MTMLNMVLRLENPHLKRQRTYSLHQKAGLKKLWKDILPAERINLVPSPGLILCHIVPHAHALPHLLQPSVQLQMVIVPIPRMKLSQVQKLIIVELNLT